MKMIQEMWNLLAGRMDFFGGLLLEHLEISLLAIAIAILCSVTVSIPALIIGMFSLIFFVSQVERST